MHQHMSSGTQPVDHNEEQHKQLPQDERLHTQPFEASHPLGATQTKGVACSAANRPRPGHTEGVGGAGCGCGGATGRCVESVASNQEDVAETSAERRDGAHVACTIDALPVEIVSEILSFLPPKDVLVAMRACRKWYEAALCSTVWRPQCDRLWRNKVYVPDHIRELKARGKAYEAFKLALKDLDRKHITSEELTRFQWSFRFKEECGGEWLDLDPWFVGRPPRVIQFRDDGVLTGFELVDFTWRFARPYRRHPDLPDEGVRIHVFPMLFYRRHPQNWGWIGESAWTQMTSFPMPPRGQSEYLETPQVTVEMQAYEIVAYNLGMDWANLTSAQEREIEEAVRAHTEEAEEAAYENTTASGQVSRERDTQDTQVGSQETEHGGPGCASEAVQPQQSECDGEATELQEEQPEQAQQAEDPRRARAAHADGNDEDDDNDEEQRAKRARTTASAGAVHHAPEEPAQP